jgi:hypothetical protein
MRRPGPRGLFAFVVAVSLPTAAAAAPPEPPRAVLDTTPVPPTGATIAVAAGEDLQAALDAARPGDVITVQAGATFTGPFTLPSKTGGGWITVRTSAPDDALPPAGTRVSPSHAAVMPTLTAAPGAGAALRTAPGAHHFRFVGIEIRPVSTVWALVDLGAGDETSEAALPHDIVIDRCYIHGNPGQEAVRGVAMNGRALAVIDSHLAGFKSQVYDTQAIMGYNGPGPFKIVNNYLEAAGENVMFGGADPSIAGLVPADIEIRRNHVVKPLAWRGVWAAVKNLFELKNARRVLVEGNVLEHVWLAAQAGFAVQLTVRNQDGTAPWSTIEDVTFRRNVVRHAGSGINILGTDDPNPSRSMQRVLVEDNLFDDVDGSTWGGAGRLVQVLDYRVGTTDVVIAHNTARQTGSILYTETMPHAGFAYRDNLTARGDYGVAGGGTGEGTDTLSTYFPGADFRRNVIVGGTASRYPADNFFPASFAAVGFVDEGGGDYRLAETSPYRNAATDGTDVGADIDAIAAATAGVVSGAPGPPPAPDATPPAVALTAPAAGATVAGAVAVAAAASDDVAVAHVQFTLDGASLGAPVTTPPYAITWDATTATPGTHALGALARDAAGNTGASAPVSVVVASGHPAPTLASLTPAGVRAGRSAFTLTVTGTGFVAASAVHWNGAPRPTTFVGDTRLTASIAATDVAAPGTASVTVVTPGPGGGTSEARTFTIRNPAPSITSLTPSSTRAGTLGLTLTVDGAGFVATSTVRWNGAARPTTFVSATRLTAAIPALDTLVPGTAAVTVATPGPGGGTSAPATFTVTSPLSLGPAPAAAAVGPARLATGAGAAIGGTHNFTRQRHALHRLRRDSEATEHPTLERSHHERHHHHPVLSRR